MPYFLRKIFIASLISIPLGILGQSTTQVAKATIKSTVSIIALDQNSQPIAMGSGAVIEKNSVITNFHVVKGAFQLKILFDGQSNAIVTSSFFGVDYDNDLILLKIQETTTPPIVMVENDNSEIGDRVFAVGNPKGLSGTFSEGIISGKRNLEKRKLIQITAPISPGSSGGPVVDNTGKLLGISVGSFKDGQNLNFAIPVEYVKKLLNSKNEMELKNLKQINQKDKDDETANSVIDAVTVRDIKIYAYNYDYYLSYTVNNGLDKPISDIKLLLLIVKKKNEEVKDYDEISLLDSKYFSENIRPHLAKSFTYKLTGNRPMEMVKTFREKIVIKVLDFKIKEN